MAKPRVLCFWAEHIAEHALDKLRQVADVDVAPSRDQQTLLNSIGDYDGYLAGLTARVDADVLANAPKLKVIGTPSTGTDHLDIPAIEAAGIEWFSIKTEFALLDRITATAELAWTLLLSSVRKVPAAHNAAMTGWWARDAFRGRQISEKTLGVLGVGRLGSMIVDYGRAFRMNVIGCDHSPRHRIEGLEYVSFDELIERADVLSIHIHLTEENRGLISRDVIARMKPGVVIVNTSRGAIIDEAALVDALESGQVGAAGLDVIEGEWRDDLADHPLIRYARDHDNLVITPHVGGITHESQVMSHQFVADKMADYW